MSPTGLSDIPLQLLTVLFRMFPLEHLVDLLQGQALRLDHHKVNHDNLNHIPNQKDQVN